MKYLLDNVDITSLMQMVGAPNDTYGGVYPNDGTKWFDLLYIIDRTPELSREAFQRGGLHTFTIVDDADRVYDAKIILRATYSARNS